MNNAENSDELHINSELIEMQESSKTLNKNVKKIDKFYYSIPIISSHLKKKIEKLKKVIENLEKHFSDGSCDFIDKGYKIDYQKALNPAQLKAVTTISGKTLVIAGAGSGKTRTLTYRASFLLENGIDAEHILIVTFTRKAADEIKKRVNHLLGAKFANSITSGTFHSFCNILLRKYHKILNINPKFTILDTGDSADLIDMIRSSVKRKKEETPFPSKEIIRDIISSSRNLLIPIEKIIQRKYHDFLDYIPQILEISHIYAEHKRNNNLYDYDDLIEEVCKHLKSNFNFKESVRKKYKYIMIDEYQDTNLPQKKFIDLLSADKFCSLMVVGDDNQSIYSFRGANYENILRFGQTYPNATLIKLEQNYRSTPHILDFVNGISDNILLGYKKKLFSVSSYKGEKPKFIHCISEEEEATFVADNVIKLKERIAYNNVAILCRSIRHSDFVQAEFTKRNIPFTVMGGLRFVDRRHIKDILAYLKILLNPLDYLSWYRILTVIPGIGKVTANNIINVIFGKQGRLDPLLISSYVKKNTDLRGLCETLIVASEKQSLVETFNIIEEYYAPILRKIEADWEMRIEDFKIIKLLCLKFKNLEQLLSSLALDPLNRDKSVFKEAQPDNDDVVKIATIHSAKGLEWNTVFLISMLDGLLPHYKTLSDYELLEEERKLFYVACSRAKEHLYLTAPCYMRKYQSFFDKYSRFISELDENLYQQKYHNFEEGRGKNEVAEKE